jgi:hypothetical protein
VREVGSSCVKTYKEGEQVELMRGVLFKLTIVRSTKGAVVRQVREVGSSYVGDT